jgi:hypothetical protein
MTISPVVTYSSQKRFSAKTLGDHLIRSLVLMPVKDGSQEPSRATAGRSKLDGCAEVGDKGTIKEINSSCLKLSHIRAERPGNWPATRIDIPLPCYPTRDARI